MVACEHGNGSNDGHGGPSDQDIMDTFAASTRGRRVLDEFELGHALGSLGCVLDEQEVAASSRAPTATATAARLRRVRDHQGSPVGTGGRAREEEEALASERPN